MMKPSVAIGLVILGSMIIIGVLLSAIKSLFSIPGLLALLGLVAFASLCPKLSKSVVERLTSLVARLRSLLK